ncbi:Hypothetical predicted protein [Paramuricea clavata]|uniref:Uncharacterized protein n=1 Tax=Paramuricea clavata TaxID=317549 RepID=A0A7D9J9A8_PARCT|nr:Hypothetical predicted protein [Paramuricea clavata]
MDKYLVVMLNIFLLEGVASFYHGANCTANSECASGDVCCEGVEECHLICIGEFCKSNDDCGERTICCQDNKCVSNGRNICSDGLAGWVYEAIAVGAFLVIYFIYKIAACLFCESNDCGKSGTGGQTPTPYAVSVGGGCDVGGCDGGGGC